VEERPCVYGGAAFGSVGIFAEFRPQNRHQTSDAKSPGRVSASLYWWAAQASRPLLLAAESRLLRLPSGRRKCASMRAIFEFPLENAEIADWLADAAVWCELVSTDSAGLMPLRSIWLTL
jgi:hypothetical protein